ncbi:glycerol-3-phosphate acyltransferase [Sporosarcina highlanderae]|uniref:Glycerol-3-phosphate acyltransferase n=1 Tax=Sporosarcina highlanderae TaxID=3035916 RepID=A0ABT8JNB0_9BACL|nr:glycerol-3-phosphate acyltransferase [Sporosarcina highlanderae]MDN4606636.1 glycerol-3-phosphate acyltransferase [Sporosarcina highlanderae]
MKIVFLLIGAYLVGNFLTATVVGKFFFKQNIRSEGSGNPGARNAGRVFGKKAFVITFIGDALKGAFVVLVAKWMGMEGWLQLLFLIAVMLGHNYPVIHRFRGGLGVSTFIGGMLAFSPLVVACFVGAFLILYPIVKSFTLAGLSAMSLSPLFLYILTRELAETMVSCIVVAVLLFAHISDYLKNKGQLN